MDRLTGRNIKGDPYFKQCFEEPCNGEGTTSRCDKCDFLIDAALKLAHYEDMEEQGKLLILPCKLWDTVWIIDQTIVDKLIGEYSILKGFVQELTIENSNNLRIKIDTPYGMMSFDKSDIGKKIFLNEFKTQEAKEALEGGERMRKPKITRCAGEGQGSCKRCDDHGIWNRHWMSMLYEIEGYDGCYCEYCVKEIVGEENND